MATPKKITTELSIDWYAVWIAKVCPPLLELIGGGPGGGIIKEATPAQRKMILDGARKIAESAAKIQSAFTKQQ
jgi:hypothetical protein